MRHKIKALIAVGMAAAVLTACSDGGTETKDSGPTVSVVISLTVISRTKLSI